MLKISNKVKQQMLITQKNNVGAAFIICSNRAIAREITELYNARSDEFNS